jgi:succinate dehydrogenase/fumarate reductase flavoprotein subunit
MLDVLVLSKDSLQQSNSTFAQGGIAGVMSPEDRFENHIEDTLKAGGGLCHADIVEMVVREAPEQINDLVRWGTVFDEEEGHLALTREGGHSHRRIVHALGDATGFEVMRAIIARSRQAPHNGVHPIFRFSRKRRTFRFLPPFAMPRTAAMRLWAIHSSCNSQPRARVIWNEGPRGLAQRRMSRTTP